jgi:hypothetical protein
VPTKGRDFDVILQGFERYKEYCAAPQATLRRTTPKPSWFQLEYWFNDYDAPQWQVPYAEEALVPATGMLPVRCLNTGVAPADVPLVKAGCPRASSCWSNIQRRAPTLRRVTSGARRSTPTGTPGVRSRSM